MNDVGWCGQQNHHVRGHSSASPFSLLRRHGIDTFCVQHGLTIEIAKHIDVITDRVGVLYYRALPILSMPRQSQPNDPSADKLSEDTLEEMKGPCYSLI